MIIGEFCNIAVFLSKNYSFMGNSYNSKLAAIILFGGSSVLFYLFSLPKTKSQITIYHFWKLTTFLTKNSNQKYVFLLLADDHRQAEFKERTLIRARVAIEFANADWIEKEHIQMACSYLLHKITTIDGSRLTWEKLASVTHMVGYR